MGINQSDRFEGIEDRRSDRHVGEIAEMEARSGGGGRGRIYDGIGLMLTPSGRRGGDIVGLMTGTVCIGYLTGQRTRGKRYV